MKIGSRVPARAGTAIRLVFAFIIYAAWTGETLLLGDGTQLVPSGASGEWILFVIIAELFIGCFIVVFFLRTSIASGMVSLSQVGLNPGRRTIPALVITGAAGSVILAGVAGGQLAVSEAAREFFLFIPISAGEVMVCWALIGTHLETVMIGSGPRNAALAGITGSALLYALPYVASGPPFNALLPVLVLLIAGMATGFVFLLFRDIYATLLAHTLTLMAVAAWYGEPGPSPSLDIPVALLAIGSAALLAAAGFLLNRRFRNGRRPAGP
jgi:hypothetical protein